MADPEHCPVCESDGSVVLLEREGGPATQNRIYRSRQAALDAPQGPLRFRRCEQCGFVWNAAFDPDLPLYGKDYINAQDKSPAFREHLQQRLDRVTQAAITGNAKTVIEIGCGQGDFLRALAARNQLADVVFFGFDPALAAPVCEARLTLIDGFFDEGSLRDHAIAPDLVVTRHTIEHIHDPMTFLKAIAAPLQRNGSLRLLLETPDYNWIARNGVTFDYFYEHCSLFSPCSMATALDRAGFDLVGYETPMGGQYMWVEAILRPEASSGRDAGPDQSAFVSHWRDRLRAHPGPAYFWGAGAKGITFATLVDPNSQLIEALIDINPDKAGMFVPLSAHPIQSPEGLVGVDNPLIVVGNPVYRTEILARLAALGVEAAVVDA